MLSQEVRKSPCQFVYRGIVGAICGVWNNRGPIFNPLAQEPTIQKVAKYGMRDPYKLCKNLMSILYKSTYLLSITHFWKTSRCGSWWIHDFRFHLLLYHQPDRPLPRLIL